MLPYEVTAAALCPWIPLCCSSVSPTLLIPSSLIKLHISSLGCSLPSESPQSLTVRAVPLHVEQPLQPARRCAASSSPSAALPRHKHHELFSSSSSSLHSGLGSPCWIPRAFPTCSCRVLGLLIAGVYPNALLEKVTPAQDRLK